MQQQAKRIDEQIVLVTGGARGLGVEIARSFAREGALVVVNYRRSEAAAPTWSVNSARTAPWHYTPT